VRFVLAGALLTVGVVAALEMLAGRLVPLFFGASYAPAVDVTRFLLVSASFASMRKLLSDCAQGAGYPSFGSLAEIVSWTVLVPALALLTPRFGINGVAASMALAYAASLAGLAVQLAHAMWGDQERRGEPALGLPALVGVELPRQNTVGDR
jgi:O-antigen/teichoic acid export membrane protein